MSTAWLIECRSPTGPVYLAPADGGGDAWTTDANDARRFPTQEIARKAWAIAGIRDASLAQHGPVRIEEHSWA